MISFNIVLLVGSKDPTSSYLLPLFHVVEKGMQNWIVFGHKTCWSTHVDQLIFSYHCWYFMRTSKELLQPSHLTAHRRFEIMCYFMCYAISPFILLCTVATQSSNFFSLPHTCWYEQTTPLHILKLKFCLIWGKAREHTKFCSVGFNQF